MAGSTLAYGLASRMDASNKTLVCVLPHAQHLQRAPQDVSLVPHPAIIPRPMGGELGAGAVLLLGCTELPRVVTGCTLTPIRCGGP